MSRKGGGTTDFGRDELTALLGGGLSERLTRPVGVANTSTTATASHRRINAGATRDVADMTVEETAAMILETQKQKKVAASMGTTTGNQRLRVASQRQRNYQVLAEEELQLLQQQEQQQQLQHQSVDVSETKDEEKIQSAVGEDPDEFLVTRQRRAKAAPVVILGKKRSRETSSSNVPTTTRSGRHYSDDDSTTSASSSSEKVDSTPRYRRRRRDASDDDDGSSRSSSSSDDSVTERRRRRALVLQQQRREKQPPQIIASASSKQPPEVSSSTSTSPPDARSIPDITDRAPKGEQLGRAPSNVDRMKADEMRVEINNQRAESSSEQGESTSDESSSGSESTSSDEEEDEVVKPKFVPKHKRGLASTIEAEIEQETNRAEKFKVATARRQQESRAMVQQIVSAKTVGDSDNTEFGMLNDMPDDKDDENDELARDEWEVREIERLLQDWDWERERLEEEQERLRRRAMTDEERLAEDAARRQKGEDPPPRPNNGNPKFFHRGAFYMDETEWDGQADVRYKAAEYAQAATGDNQYRDRKQLPKVMQVKKFGFANQSKYKGLAAEDTTDRQLDILPLQRKK